jgi:hypothetical protein
MHPDETPTSVRLVRWLPKLASLLPVSLPVPLVKGLPAAGYRGD